jgi:hypothetical protein
MMPALARRTASALLALTLLALAAPARALPEGDTLHREPSDPQPAPASTPAPALASTPVANPAPAPAPELIPAPTPIPAAAPAPTPAPAAQPTDIAEAPFAFGDFSWLNGNNRQPESLLKVGPVLLSLIVDGYYLWALHRPIDHTAFPSTTAPRHNELSLNMASIGIELPPNAIDGKAGGPVGQFSLQYGAMGETNFGQDRTLSRGFFLTKSAFLPIRTASAGWHFHWLHGVNVEVGIFPSYAGMESYIPQENWNYLHPFLSDFTPYYFSGVRTQIFPTQKLKVELWVVNGWQTFGQWNEGRAGGFLVNHRPTERLSLTSTVYAGQEGQGDPKSSRWYSDNYAQYQYFKDGGGLFRSAALCLVADVGYEYRSDGTRDGMRTGYSLTHRVEFKDDFAFTLRGDIYYDRSQALLPSFPIESKYSRPDQDKPFLGGGVTTTLDYWPSPWLLTRLEFMHREANIPLFSGRGGITGPGGVAPVDAAATQGFVPDVRKSDNRVVANVTLRL